MPRQALCINSQPPVIGNLSNSLETPNSDKNSRLFGSCGIEIWHDKKNQQDTFFYITASVVHHFVAICEFTREITVRIWRMSSKNNRTTPLCHFKLFALFRSHLWIQTRFMIRKWLNCAKFLLTSMTFHLWPWPFPWTSPLSLVITPENFNDDTMTGALRKKVWQTH